MADGETEKTPAQLQRESIAVVTSENNITDDNNDNEKDEQQEEETEKEKDETEGEEGKKEEETEKTDGDDEGDSEDEKKEDDPEKLKKTIERLKRRVSTKTSEAKENAKQLAEAQAKLKTIEENEGKSVLTEEDVETRAEALAKEKQAQREFEQTLDKLQNEAVAIDKTFPTKVTELGEDYGKIPAIMIDMLGDIPRGGAVLNYLCDNPDEYEKICAGGQLKVSPGKALVKLNEISESLKPKKPVKDISKVPPPNKPVKTANNVDQSTTITGKESMDEFVRKRNAQVQKRREMRGH